MLSKLVIRLLLSEGSSFGWDFFLAKNSNRLHKRGATICHMLSVLVNKDEERTIFCIIGVVASFWGMIVENLKLGIATLTFYAPTTMTSGMAWEVDTDLSIIFWASEISLFSSAVALSILSTSPSTLKVRDCAIGARGVLLHHSHYQMDNPLQSGQTHWTWSTCQKSHELKRNHLQPYSHIDHYVIQGSVFNNQAYTHFIWDFPHTSIKREK